MAQENQVQTTPAPPPSDAGRNDLIEAAFDARPAMLRTNLAVDPSLLTRLMCKAATTAQDCVGKTLMVRGYMLSYGDMPADADSGEISRGYTLIMLLADGSTVGTSSKTLIESFARIVGVMGNGQWAQPVPVRIIAHASRSGPGKWLQCYIDDDAADAPHDDE